MRSLSICILASAILALSNAFPAPYSDYLNGLDRSHSHSRSHSRKSHSPEDFLKNLDLDDPAYEQDDPMLEPFKNGDMDDLAPNDSMFEREDPIKPSKREKSLFDDDIDSREELFKAADLGDPFGGEDDMMGNNMDEDMPVPVKHKRKSTDSFKLDDMPLFEDGDGLGRVADIGEDPFGNAMNDSGSDDSDSDFVDNEEFKASSHDHKKHRHHHVEEPVAKRHQPQRSRKVTRRESFDYY